MTEDGSKKAHQEAIEAANRIHEKKSRGMIVIAELSDERQEGTNRQAEGVGESKIDSTLEAVRQSTIGIRI